MRMKNPVHPGELVKANLEELGLATARAAEALGVTRQQLHNVINGKSSVSPEMAVRFEKAFGGSADMWLRMQAAYDLARVRQHETDITVVRQIMPRSAGGGVTTVKRVYEPRMAKLAAARGPRSKRRA
jgi:antitoxin HigA-1